jgi:hypothetical protein
MSYTDEFVLRFQHEPDMVVVNCTTSPKTCYMKMSYNQEFKIVGVTL